MYVCIQVKVFDLESVCSLACGATATPLHSLQDPSDLKIQFAMLLLPICGLF